MSLTLPIAKGLAALFFRPADFCRRFLASGRGILPTSESDMTATEAMQWDQLEELARSFKYDIVSTPRAVKLARARLFLQSIAYRHPEWIIKRLR